jgi:hypothetical protein
MVHLFREQAKRYQRLSPVFLSEAVGKLDTVFVEASGAISAKNGEERRQNVTGKLALTDGSGANG